MKLRLNDKSIVKAALLAAAFCASPAFAQVRECPDGKVCTERVGDWIVIADMKARSASMMTKTQDGSVAFLNCRISRDSGCFLTFTIPRSSCTPGRKHRSVVSIAGAMTPVDLLCLTGRDIPTFALLGDQDVVLVVRNQMDIIVASEIPENVIYTQFSNNGASEAVSLTSALVVELLTSQQGGNKK